MHTETKPDGRTRHARDRRRLENALCTLADYEGVINRALVHRGNHEHELQNTILALRDLIDGRAS
jgi:hypothetical protein